MKILQLIGHKPSLKCTETGSRKSFKDMHDLCRHIKTQEKISNISGLQQLPDFFQELIGYNPDNSHTIQLTEGGLS
jgi:hypothetical protein